MVYMYTISWWLLLHSYTTKAPLLHENGVYVTFVVYIYTNSSCIFTPHMSRNVHKKLHSEFIRIWTQSYAKDSICWFKQLAATPYGELYTWLPMWVLTWTTFYFISHTKMDLEKFREFPVCSLHSTTTTTTISWLKQKQNKNHHHFYTTSRWLDGSRVIYTTPTTERFKCHHTRCWIV
jgi:hypothetical protein